MVKNERKIAQKQNTQTPNKTSAKYENCNMKFSGNNLCGNGMLNKDVWNEINIFLAWIAPNKWEYSAQYNNKTHIQTTTTKGGGKIMEKDESVEYIKWFYWLEQISKNKKQ